MFRKPEKKSAVQSYEKKRQEKAPQQREEKIILVNAQLETIKKFNAEREGELEKAIAELEWKIADSLKKPDVNVNAAILRLDEIKSKKNSLLDDTIKEKIIGEMQEKQNELEILLKRAEKDSEILDTLPEISQLKNEFQELVEKKSEYPLNKFKNYLDNQ